MLILREFSLDFRVVKYVYSRISLDFEGILFRTRVRSVYVFRIGQFWRKNSIFFRIIVISIPDIFTGCTFYGSMRQENM